MKNCPRCEARKEQAREAGTKVQPIWEVGTPSAHKSPTSHTFLRGATGPVILCNAIERDAETQRSLEKFAGRAS